MLPRTVRTALLCLSLLGWSGGCTRLLQVGPRALSTRDTAGGEVFVSYELGAASQKDLYDKNYNGRSDFLSLGAEASLGAMRDSEANDTAFSGSAMLFAGVNFFGAKQPDPQLLGLKVNLGLGTRLHEGQARFALQGDLQIVYARHESVGMGISVMAGYLPGPDVTFVGIGITVNYFDRTLPPKVGF